MKPVQLLKIGTIDMRDPAILIDGWHFATTETPLTTRQMRQAVLAYIVERFEKTGISLPGQHPMPPAVAFDAETQANELIEKLKRGQL